MSTQICFVCLKQSPVFSADGAHNFCESCSNMKSKIEGASIKASQSTQVMSQENEKPVISLGKRKREPEEQKASKRKA
jgi:hypothetical protein